MTSPLRSVNEIRLGKEILQPIREVAYLAAAGGLRVYLVGGTVRDLLLGRPTLDIDLAVEGDALELARALSERSGWQITGHHRFGTAKLRRDHLTVDLASARRETYSKPGALPDVRPGTIKDDLARRDFTINAMSVEVGPGAFGDIVDPFDGRGDLGRKLIRVLHPRSFVDDPTRIFRAIRYEQRLGFELECETGALLRGNVPWLDAVSGDRLRHELELMLKEESPEKALSRAGELGVLAQVDASLSGNGWLAARFREARDLGWASPNLYLALFGCHLEDPERLILKLKFTRQTAEVVRQASALRRQSQALGGPDQRPSAIWAGLEGYSQTAIRVCILASDDAAVRARMSLYLDRLRYVKPHLSGDDLMRLGVPQGEPLGKLLRELRRSRLDGDIGTREQEIEVVRRWLATLN